MKLYPENRIRRLLFLISCATALAAAENWPQFRGAKSDGVAEGRPPERWSASENVLWSVPIPGHGWSSPAVWGDRIFLTSVIPSAPIEMPKKGLYFGGNRLDPPRDEHRWMLYAVDWRTGRIAWQREVHRGVPEFSRHLKNTFASETPVTDGERVCAYFGQIGIFCYDMQGKPLWSRRMGPFKTRYGWGTASSPVMHGGRIYIQNDNDDGSFLTALDKKTGEPVWRVERDEGSNWATPYVWESGRRVEIVTNGTRAVRSYDLDGKLLWQLRGNSSIAIPTPLSAHGLLYVTSGYVGDETRPVFAVRPGARGDITLPKGSSSSESIAWHLPQGGPYNPSPIVYGDYYYTLLDRGFLTCHDARTGKEIYGKQRIDPDAGAFTASPWAYNGKLFLLSEDGDTYVVEAGPAFKLLGKNSLGEMSMATPAIVRDSLVIRTAAKLYRIGSR
jgi:outer membrane protein assembly factor BamB